MPKPQAGTGFDKRDMTDSALIEWVSRFLDVIFPVPDPPAAAEPSADAADAARTGAA